MGEFSWTRPVEIQLDFNERRAISKIQRISTEYPHFEYLERSLNDLVKIRLDTADDDMRFYNKYLDMATLYEKCALFSQ